MLRVHVWSQGLGFRVSLGMGARAWETRRRFAACVLKEVSEGLFLDFRFGNAV